MRALLRRRRPAATPAATPVSAGVAASEVRAPLPDVAVAGPGAGPEPVIVVHGVEIDPARRRVRVAGSEVVLTNQEFVLLHLLATHPGIVFSREALLARIWKNETFVTERSVDTLVKRLRRKIEDDAANPRFVLTVWGVGYKFADV